MVLNSALVENGWVKGFAREPGRNADYRAGRCLMWGGTRHLTVGRCAGDRSIGARGIFQAYVPRGAGCGPGATMFAQLDAVCFHNCEWNAALTGCEVEWLPGETFTDYQIDRCGLWVAALISVGVPNVDLTLPGAARFPVGSRIGGFVDHNDLQHKACDQHTDGWAAHWPAIHAAALRHLGGGTVVPPPPLTQGDDDMRVVVNDATNDAVAARDGFVIEQLGKASAAFGQFPDDNPRGQLLAKVYGIVRVAQVQFETLKPLAVAPGAPAPGLTKADLDSALAPFKTLLPGV